VDFLSQFINEEGRQAGEILEGIDYSLLGDVILARDETYFDGLPFSSAWSRASTCFWLGRWKRAATARLGVSLALDQARDGLRIVGLAEDRARFYARSWTEAATLLITVFFICLPPTFVERPLSNPLSFRPGNHSLGDETVFELQPIKACPELALSRVEGRSRRGLLEPLDGVYPEQGRRAQDKHGALIAAIGVHEIDLPVVVLAVPEGDLAAVRGPNRRDVAAISGNGKRAAVVGHVPYRPFLVGQVDAEITVVGDHRTVGGPGRGEAVNVAKQVVDIAILQPHHAQLPLVIRQQNPTAPPEARYCAPYHVNVHPAGAPPSTGPAARKPVPVHPRQPDQTMPPSKPLLSQRCRHL
jgi:hypothetical protein